MAHAYTPGLKVARRTTIRKRHILPVQGRVVVEQGQSVRAGAVVAEADLPGQVHPVNVVNRLGIRPEEIRRYMLKQEGDAVERDEPIAETNPWIKWFKVRCPSPVAGAIESVSDVTGQVMVREPPQKIALSAYISGTVVEVIPGEGAVVETEAALVQGIFGIGGECGGRLKVLAQSPGGVVRPQALDSTCQNCIIVVGSLATAALVEAARDFGVSALVAGGMPAEDLRQVLGYDIGVAVTGSETIGLTLVLTEGFGSIPIAQRTFELLKELDGLRASANGATQIRAGVLRPEIIVPLEGPVRDTMKREPAAEADGLRVGDQIRIIRQPNFGLIGEVAELVPDQVEIETEAKVRVLRVRTARGDTITVPRANTEVIKG